MNLVIIMFICYMGVIRPVGSEKLRFTQRIGENLMDKLKLVPGIELDGDIVYINPKIGITRYPYEYCNY